MRWPNAKTNPGDRAPGRYCLAVCYCGDCDHYQPLPDPAARHLQAAAQRITRPPRDAVWWAQQEDR